jgi:hypothetical protein
MLTPTYALLSRIRGDPRRRFFASAERVAPLFSMLKLNAPGNQLSCDAPYATLGTSVAVNLNHCGTISNPVVSGKSICIDLQGITDRTAV